jgi:hypothetical protein
LVLSEGVIFSRKPACRQAGTQRRKVIKQKHGYSISYVSWVVVMVEAQSITYGKLKAFRATHILSLRACLPAAHA